MQCNSRHQPYVTLLSPSGSLIQKFSYGAWGNLRNPKNYSQPFSGTPLLRRGFTGHEMLPQFGLINMNGRFYDPRLGRFLNPDNFVQLPDFSQNFNRYAYCLNNPLVYTDPSGYWFGIDDAIAAGLGFVVGYVSYGIATGNFGWKAVAAGGVGAVVAWVGWNTMGAGNVALAATGGAGSATSFTSGLGAVFGSSGGYYGGQFATLTVMNSLAHKDQLSAADDKGWGGVLAFAGYTTSAMLSTSLNPFTLGTNEAGLGLRQFAGVVLTDNISDNMEDGRFNWHSVHVGPIGYDWNRHDDSWGGTYTIFSKGLNGDQRFGMAFEMVLGLSLIKADIKMPRYRNYPGNCGGGQWLPTLPQFKPHVIALSKLGYYARRSLELSDTFFMLWKQKTTFGYWYSRYYHDDGTIKD